jgi:hypothetical protein
MPDDRETAKSEATAAKERVAARAKKEKENIARLSAQGTERRCLTSTPATIAPGFGGHGDRSSGEESADAEIGALIPDPEVFRDLSITPMTGWRWDRDPHMAALGWPPPIYRGRYKHRDANQYRKFKANLLQQAIKRRNVLLRKRNIETTEEEGATA